MKTTEMALSALKDIASELIDIATIKWTTYDEWCDSESGILDSARVRELGQQANRIGGFLAMSGVCEALLHMVKDRGLLIAMRSELNHRWHGIGDWLC
jgi:hypothetical protein